MLGFKPEFRKQGMVFTIEPMINQAWAKVKTKRDGWTVVTSDKKLSAQWAHTVAVTSSGFEVFTLRDEELGQPGFNQPGFKQSGEDH